MSIGPRGNVLRTQLGASAIARRRAEEDETSAELAEEFPHVTY
jgi:hypothetical protein